MSAQNFCPTHYDFENDIFFIENMQISLLSDEIHTFISVTSVQIGMLTIVIYIGTVLNKRVS